MKFVKRLLLRVAYAIALTYWFLRRPQGRGAYVAVWHAGRVLTIRNSYKRGLTFPAGGIGRNESAEQAAIRELQEEVGIRIPLEALRFAGTFVSYSEFKQDVSSVFEYDAESLPQFKIDGTEVCDAEFVAFEELVDRQSELTEIARQYVQTKQRELLLGEPLDDSMSARDQLQELVNT